MGVCASAFRSGMKSQMLINHDYRATEVGLSVKEQLDLVRGNSSLKVVRLGNRSLDAHTMAELHHCLQMNTTVTDVDISHNQLGLPGITAIARCLVQNPTLRKLTLTECGLGDEAMKVLVDPLMHNHTLDELVLSGNEFPKEGCIHMREILQFNNSLQRIDLSYCKLGPNQIEDLGKALPFTFTLSALQLNHNGFGDVGITALGHGLCRNKGLRWLDVANNNISSSGIKEFFHPLNKASGIQHLNFSNNSIGPTGCKAVCEALTFLPELRSLILHDCGIGNRGIQFLEYAFSTEDLRSKHGVRTTLACLDVSNCNIDLAGVPALATILANENFNRPGSATDAARDLAEAYVEPVPLQVVDISQNNLMEEGAKRISAAVRSNPSLLAFFCEGCNFPDEVVHSFTNHIRANRNSQGLDRLDVASKHAQRDPELYGEMVLASEPPTDSMAGITLQRLMNNDRRTVRVDLRCQRLTARLMQGVSRSLRVNHVIRHLDLMHNDLGDIGLAHLAEGLQGKRLISLNITGNRCKPAATKSVLAILRENPTLEHLWISDNKWGTTGSEKICELIKMEVQGLKTFCIELAGITGGLFLKSVMDSLMALETFSISHNELDALATETMVPVLTGHPSLKVFDAVNTQMTPETALSFYRMVKSRRNKQIQVLSIGGERQPDIDLAMAPSMQSFHASTLLSKKGRTKHRILR